VGPNGHHAGRSEAAKIFPVSKDDSEDTRGPGAIYLDDALNRLGFRGNAELSRLTGATEGLLWKWRQGKATPTAKNLRKVVSVIVPLARATGIVLDPVEFYVRFELITREELEPEPVDSLYLELIQLDRETELAAPELNQKLREMVWLVIDGMQKQFDERKANPGTGRKRNLS